MIFNKYFKLNKNKILNKFKNIQIIKYNKYKYLNIKNLNILFYSKNSNNYNYSRIIYNIKYIKLLYILSNYYNKILLKLLYFWFTILNYKINYQYYILILNIFTYF
uniref:Uncharacterized protein n=1 Tax=Leucocytozoon caulleryi TaxID=211597 RepID=U3TU12_LEUCU|nr:hypothetical protein [Leucocytozoon caulleryi]BAN94687.1 hypothetical protein [Leucocytozoon caulleryi]